MRAVLWLTLLLISNIAFSQDAVPVDEIATSFPTHFLEKVKQQSNKLEKMLLLRTEKMLSKLAKQESRLKRKLAKKDSLQAKVLFGDVSNNYGQLLQSLKDTITSSERISYLPHLDTLKTSLAFLSSNARGLMNSKSNSVSETLQSVQSLETHLQKTEQIKKIISERRALLKQQLSQFNLVKDFTSEKRYRKRQKEHAKKNPDADFEFTVIDRGKPGKDLHMKEQNHIDMRGGAKTKNNPNGKLSNQRNPGKRYKQKT